MDEQRNNTQPEDFYDDIPLKRNVQASAEQPAAFPAPPAEDSSPSMQAPYDPQRYDPAESSSRPYERPVQPSWSATPVQPSPNTSANYQSSMPQPKTPFSAAENSLPPYAASYPQNTPPLPETPGPIPTPVNTAAAPFGTNTVSAALPPVLDDDSFHSLFADDDLQSDLEKKKRKKKSVLPLIASLVLVVALLTVVGFNTHIYSENGGLRIHSFNHDFRLFQKAQGTGDDSTPPLNEGDNNSLPADGDGIPIVDTNEVGQALSVSQIAKKVKPSVVGVVSESLGYNGGSSGTGSGIISTADGYIITNQHVVDKADKVTVVLSDGEKYVAKVVGADKKTDIAVLKIEATDLPPAEFGNSDQLEDGDLAVAIGNPFGMELQGTVTSGIISAINRNIVIDDRTMTLIQTDASINPGNSGGPLINRYGQVIGINSIKLGSSNYEGLGFAIPSNVFQPIVKELKETGAILGRPVIGISGTVITEAQANYYDIPKGVYVNEVNPNADAAKKGLRAGDIIVGINGKTIETLVELNDGKDVLNVNDTITLKIYRNGQYTEIAIALMDENKLAEEGNAFQLPQEMP